jgi:hypothetical protein
MIPEIKSWIVDSVWFPEQTAELWILCASRNKQPDCGFCMIPWTKCWTVDFEWFPEQTVGLWIFNDSRNKQLDCGFCMIRGKTAFSPPSKAHSPVRLCNGDSVLPVKWEQPSWILNRRPSGCTGGQQPSPYRSPVTPCQARAEVSGNRSSSFPSTSVFSCPLSFQQCLRSVKKFCQISSATEPKNTAILFQA